MSEVMRLIGDPYTMNTFDHCMSILHCMPGASTDSLIHWPNLAQGQSSSTSVKAHSASRIILFRSSKLGASDSPSSWCRDLQDAQIGGGKAAHFIGLARRTVLVEHEFPSLAEHHRGTTLSQSIHMLCMMRFSHRSQCFHID